MRGGRKPETNFLRGEIGKGRASSERRGEKKGIPEHHDLGKSLFRLTLRRERRSRNRAGRKGKGEKEKKTEDGSGEITCGCLQKGDSVHAKEDREKTEEYYGVVRNLSDRTRDSHTEFLGGGYKSENIGKLSPWGRKTARNQNKNGTFFIKCTEPSGHCNFVRYA